ncbi:hypothetical protein T492DRAFT_869373 [Pavlovales sp. CCMP2436]|nr:hypothetical protein T492DRAFT_869373 [Pavlovales sp. CCMP2436]
MRSAFAPRTSAVDEAALPPLLRVLAGDPLRAILKLLGGADLTCARLACRDFRDHSSPAEEAMPRSGFLRTRALVVFAWERMFNFVLDLPMMLLLAASFGYVFALEELVDNRQCALAADACAAAAGKGQLAVLTWLHSRGCSWDRTTCVEAARGGHLEVLRYAHEHGCSWYEETGYWAAAGGHLEVLRYAHEHGCPGDDTVCCMAAVGGHLEVLRYAHEHGYQMGIEECVEEACKNDHDTVDIAVMSGAAEPLLGEAGRADAPSTPPRRRVTASPTPGLEIDVERRAQAAVGLAEWKLAERHHRVRLALAYLGESEFSGPPFTVRYKQLSRRELTEPTDAATFQRLSRLPSGLLPSRRVEQLVGGFIRTRDSLSAMQPSQSLILVRCGAIVIRLFHLRAIVVHDGLYIALDPQRGKAERVKAEEDL